MDHQIELWTQINTNKMPAQAIAQALKLNDAELAKQITQRQSELDARHPQYVAAQAKVDTLREDLARVSKPEKKIRLMKMIEKQTTIVSFKGKWHHRTALIVQAMRDELQKRRRGAMA